MIERRLPLVALLAALPLFGCGGEAMSPSAAKSPAGEAAPSAMAVGSAEGVDGELAALAQAEHQIEAFFPHTGGAPRADAARGQERKPADPASQKSAEPMSADAACATACKALSSMQRSAEHLCVLTGGEDARCGDARTRVRSATERVHAACPACAAP